MSYKFENRIQIGFSDGYAERRISKNQFFLQLNQLIDWQPIEKELKPKKTLLTNKEESVSSSDSLNLKKPILLTDEQNDKN